jgi:hypothetical protein
LIDRTTFRGLRLWTVQDKPRATKVANLTSEKSEEPYLTGSSGNNCLESRANARAVLYFAGYIPV